MIIVIVAVAEGGIEMANYMVEIAKLCGLELGEVFRLTGHKDIYFKFVYDDLFGGASPDTVTHKVEPQNLVDILTGKCRVIKYFSKPKYGDIYYVACPANVMDMYEIFHWTDSAVDEEYYKRGLVFPTADMALEATKSIIAMLKGEMDSEPQVVTHMRELAELLGIGFEETFQINDVEINLKLKSDGLYGFSPIAGLWTPVPTILLNLVTGVYSIHKSIRKLVKGEEYFIPDFTVSSLACAVTWSDSDFDNCNAKNHLVCLTKEEAVNLAKKMLALAEEK